MVLTVSCLAALCWGFWRRPALEQAAYVAAVAIPVPTAAILLALAARAVTGGRDRRSEEVLLLVRLAAQLRSGSTLRTAIDDISHGVASLERAGRLAGAGRPIPEVVEAMSEGLGRFSDLTGASLRMAATSGGPLAPVVEQVVVQALALDDLHRERRSAMAPGLLQAAVVGGIPAVVLCWMAFTGRWVDLVERGAAHAAVVIAGTVLVLGGVAVTTRIALGERL